MPSIPKIKDTPTATTTIETGAPATVSTKQLSSTPHVHTATDRKIRDAFATKIPGTTKLIIAQRISSVQDADRIIVLDNGELNGFGTHEELLQTNAIYRDVYESQTGGGGDFDEGGAA